MVGIEGTRLAQMAGVAALIAAIALPGCASTVSRRIDDGTITTRVKTALLNDPELGLLRLEVVTVEGVVTLTGTVHSEEQASRAARLARAVNGVRAVESNLVVRPPGRPSL